MGAGGVEYRSADFLRHLMTVGNLLEWRWVRVLAFLGLVHSLEQ